MKQRTSIAALGLCLALVSQCAVGQLTAVRDIINGVSLDSLFTTVRVLTGEIGSQNGGTSGIIEGRYQTDWGHELAAGYLETRLRALGLTVQRQTFPTGYIRPGVNLLAEQRGSLYPDQKIILAAHYDAVCSTSNEVAIGADDDASGCAAVLEGARLLMPRRTAYTILYALFDLEELSRAGSTVYAKEARARGDSIVGVLDLDMLAYDANNDSVMNIQCQSTIGQSQRLADTVLYLNRMLSLGLKPLLPVPASYGSDHGSFWKQKYSAILLSEAFSGSDFNRYNHTQNDRWFAFNMPYFHRLTRLAVGSLALLAGIQEPEAVAVKGELPISASLEQNYPNPFNPSTTIRYSLPGRSHVSLTVFNTLGRTVAELVNGDMAAGLHEVHFRADGLSSGVYFYRLKTEACIQTRAMAVLK